MRLISKSTIELYGEKMKNLSSYIEPQDALDLDLVRLRLWINQDDEEIEYYDLPSETINSLQDFVSKGKLNPELTADLRSALDEIPAWKDLNIEDLSKEQREGTTAVYVRSKGRRMELVFRMQLNANVF